MSNVWMKNCLEQMHEVYHEAIENVHWFPP